MHQAEWQLVLFLQRGRTHRSAPTVCSPIGRALKASLVGALKKCAGGTFLATDRSGYAARREVVGRKKNMAVGDKYNLGATGISPRSYRVVGDADPYEIG